MGAASPVQFDKASGFDISSLLTGNNSQLAVAISEYIPLSDIGGIIALAGENGASWPGVTSNPRFKRYLWLDLTSDTIKVYSNSNVDDYQSWINLSVPAAYLTGQKFKSIGIDKFISGGISSSRWLLRTNTGATNLEFIAPNSIFSQTTPGTTDLTLAALDATNAPTGPASDSFLRSFDLGGGERLNVWDIFSPADVIVPTFININPFGAGNITKVISQVLTAIFPDDSLNSIFPTSSSVGVSPIVGIAPGKISTSGRQEGFILTLQGGVLDFRQVPITQQIVVLGSSNQNTFPVSRVQRTVRLLSTELPLKFVEYSIICIQDDGGNTGYTIGDEVKAENIWDQTSTYNPIAASWGASSSGTGKYNYSLDLQNISGVSPYNVKVLFKGHTTLVLLTLGVQCPFIGLLRLFF